jgi:hypothetical protein
MHGALLEGTYESFGADNDLHIVGLVGANEFLVTTKSDGILCRLAS